MPPAPRILGPQDEDGHAAVRLLPRLVGDREEGMGT